MGSHVSQLIDEEKINWVRPHELVYNPDLRKQQLLLLPKFARKLQLCYQTDRFFQYISCVFDCKVNARAFDPEKDFAFASLTREVETSYNLKSIIKFLKIYMQLCTGIPRFTLLMWRHIKKRRSKNHIN